MNAISTANQSMSAPPEAGELLIIPAGYQAERAPGHKAKASAHRKNLRPVARTRAVPVTTAAHRRAAGYKTAAVAQKSHPAAN